MFLPLLKSSKVASLQNPADEDFVRGIYNGDLQYVFGARKSITYAPGEM